MGVRDRPGEKMKMGQMAEPLLSEREMKGEFTLVLEKTTNGRKAAPWAPDEKREIGQDRGNFQFQRADVVRSQGPAGTGMASSLTNTHGHTKQPK